VYGSFIRAVRESRGLTQEEVAETVGTSQPTLSAYEHDRKSPSAETLNRVLAACGYLLTAKAGDKEIACELPTAGWFPDEDFPPRDELDDALRDAEDTGRMRHDATPASRIEAISQVLTLAESQDTVRRRT